MANIPAISKYGYYPAPQAALDGAVALVKPAKFNGARGFDLTAGEGTAMQFISSRLNITPYTNEYDTRRSAECVNKFGSLNAMSGDFFDLDISLRSAHYGWINPPFQGSESGSYNRTEMQFLDKQMHYYAPGAVLQFLCYTQHLATFDQDGVPNAAIIFENCENVTVYTIPGLDLGYYKMILVTMVKKDKPGMRAKDLKWAQDLQSKCEGHYHAFRAWRDDKDNDELKEIAEGFFPSIDTVTEPLYAMKEVKFGTYFKFYFAQKELDDKKYIELINEYLPSIAAINGSGLYPKEETTKRNVVFQPRERQTQSLIAAGILNNFVVQTDEGPAVIRAVTRQIEKEVEEPKPIQAADEESEVIAEETSDDAAMEPETPAKKDVIVKRFISAPKTTITLLYQTGRIENIDDDAKLAEFIKTHSEAIMVYIQSNFIPDYTFDMNEGKLSELLTAMRVQKVDKKTGKIKRMRLFPAQKHVVAAGYMHLRKDRSLIIAGEMGVGKLQPLSSRIYTPDGYKTMGEIQVGDSVIAQDGAATKVLAVFPHPEMDIYEVTFTDGSKTRCGLDHLWEVNSPLRKSRGQSGQVKTLGEIMQKPLAHKNGNWQNFIPMVEAVEFEPKVLPIAPYVLGVLIGDGGLTGRTLVISSADQEILDAVQIESGCQLVKSGKYDYRISAGTKFSTNPFTEKLKSTGLMGKDSFDKFIPKNYLYSAVHQRISLLQGLMDTDGSVSGGNNSNGEYTTTSKQLSEDVKELVQSLGGTVHIAERYTTYEYKGEKKTGALSYRVQFVVPFGIMPFRLARKRNLYNMPTKYNPTRAMTKIELVGKELAQCILVEDEQHLYVTDEFIVTHNTAIMTGIMETMRYRDHGKNKHVFDEIPKDSQMRPDQFNIVLSPPHLVNKWTAEIKGMFKNAYVGVIASGTGYKPIITAMNYIRGIDNQPADALKVLIISREMIKVGESQPLTSKVYTPSGYKLMGDIKVGDVVSTPDGNTSNVVSIHPQGELDIYQVTFKDGRSVECTENHLWNVTNSQRKYKNLPFQVKSLKEIMEKPLAYPGKPSRYLNYVQLVESVHFDDKALPIDPYVLGILLGDGSLSGKEVKFTSADTEIVEEIRKNIPDGFKVSQYGDIEFAIVMDKRTGGKSSFLESLRSLGIKGHKADTKFVPELYKYNSVDKRIALLQGLFDSDGTVAGRGKQAVDFAVISKQLADDVQEIAQSLGAKVTRSYREGGYKKVGQSLPIHRLYISFPRSIKPFRLSRKANAYNPGSKWDSMQPIVNVELVRKDLAQCILIDSKEHLYVTDGCVVTHNTWEPAVNQKIDYMALRNALGADRQFTSEDDLQNLLAGSVVSPDTGLPIQKVLKGGAGVKLAMSKLRNRRHYTVEEDSDTGRIKPVKRRKQYPPQKSRLDAANKVALREITSAEGLGEEIEKKAQSDAEYIILQKMQEIRLDRQSFDAQHGHLGFLWQETRNERNRTPIGVELARRLGKKDKSVFIGGGEFEIKRPAYVVPLPDVVKGQMKEVEYHATYRKHPRAGIQGLAKFLATYFGDRIYMLVADEVHEYAAGDDSSQGLALLRLSNVADKLLYGTGTLYKGVASSMYFIEFTTNDGMKVKYPWGHVMAFVAKMGVVERVVKITQGNDGKNSKKDNKTERLVEKPGCAADLLAMIIDHTIFLSVDEVGAEVPERIDRAVPVYMNDEMSEIYRKADRFITSYLNTCLQLGDNSFMGTAFHAMLNWANWPYQKYPVYHTQYVEDKNGNRIAKKSLVYTIPATTSDMTNKDKVIIEDIRKTLKKGNGCAVYFHQTGLHNDNPDKDIMQRFSDLLKLHVPEARPEILRSTVSTTKREEWLENKVEKGMNVLLCNPNLVKTGLDLLWARHIMWYELDYSLSTVDQASGRAARIGQDQVTELSFYFNVLKPEKPAVQDASIELDEDGNFVAGSGDDLTDIMMNDVMHMAFGDDLSNVTAVIEPKEEELVPIGPFEFDTMEARGILIVDKKRQAARFLYGQGGGSLANVAEQAKTLVEELAEAVRGSKVIQSAASLFRKAFLEEKKDLELSSEAILVDDSVEADPDDIVSEKTVLEVRKHKRAWKPLRKSYTPNLEKHQALLDYFNEDVPVVETVQYTEVEEEVVVEQEALPEFVMHEAPKVEEYKTIQLSKDLYPAKWKEDGKKFGAHTTVPSTEEGVSDALVFTVDAERMVVWVKITGVGIVRRSVVNMNIVAAIEYV